MHLSVFMGPISLGPTFDKAMIDLCIDEAIACADAGYAMVTFGEQHLNDYEPYANPFLMGARLAPHLGDTWFGTTVVPLVFHHPLRVAEDANVIDLLTRGRFIMGLSSGRGGPVPDFRVWDLPMERRDEIFNAKLDDMNRIHALRTGDAPLQLGSEWDHGELAGRMMPASWRVRGPLKAIGTNTDVKIDGVARRGYPLFLGPCLPEAAAEKLARHRAAMEEAGIPEQQRREAARLSLVTRHVFCGRTEERAWEIAEALAGRNPMMDRSVDRRSLRELSKADLTGDPAPRNSRHVQEWMAGGTPDQLIETFRGYAAAGVEHVNIRFTAGTADPALVAESYELFTREVLPNIGHELFPALRDDEVDPLHLAKGVA